MGRRHVERLSHALRREAQVRSWRRSQKNIAASSVSEASSTSTSAAVPRSSAGGGAPSLPTSTATTSTGAAGVTWDDGIIHANYSLRHALARGAPETPLARQVRHAIRQSAGQAEALASFEALLLADGESPTAATFKTLSATLLRHHVEKRVGKAAFERALADAAGCEGGEGWKNISEEERSTFVNYTCRMTERWSERGSSYNKLLGFTQEGTDNEVVTKVEYQMRKSSVMVPATSLADLMHLDITWSTALHLYNYARELRKNIPPPVEMSDRLMGLMTGYKTGLGGSRPWRRAWELYQEVLASGFETSLTTHTHALDALWRSADTFHRVHHTLSPSHQQWVWEKALEVSQRVQNTSRILVTGEEGCAYAESLVKAFASSGRWSEAISILSTLDNSSADVSFRFLVPTAETYAFAIVASHASGHTSHGEALWTLFKETYTLRSLHSEALLILLQSLRHVMRTSQIPAHIVEDLVNDGKGLERPVVVAALQLISSKYVKTNESRLVLATKLLDMYDTNPWPQQPFSRKAELQTVFRCCHLIAAMEGSQGKSLCDKLRSRLVNIFGSSSPEVEWLNDTSIYALQVTSNWKEAMTIYNTTVGQRKPEHVPYLPIPLRQAKLMLTEALVRACKALEEDGDLFLVDEDTREADRDASVTLIEWTLAVIKNVYTADDTFPHNLYAELLLMQALSAAKSSQRKLYALEAMRHFSQASAVFIEHHTIASIATALSLTEIHVENALLEGHATLRYTALSQRNDHKKTTKVAPTSGFDVVTW